MQRIDKLLQIALTVEDKSQLVGELENLFCCYGGFDSSYSASTIKENFPKVWELFRILTSPNTTKHTRT